MSFSVVFGVVVLDSVEEAVLAGVGFFRRVRDRFLFAGASPALVDDAGVAFED